MRHIIKVRLLSIALFLFLLTSALIPIIGAQTLLSDTVSNMLYVEDPLDSSNKEILWDPKDEGDHFPCGCEWWWLYSMLTLDDGSHWDMCIQFLYQMNWTGKQWSETDGDSYIRIQSWNRETGKYFDCLHIKKHPGILQHKKNMVDLKFYNSTLKGLYPNYTAHLEDDINNIELTVDFHAMSVPHWAAQEPLNGVIPWGTGTFRYYSIPFGEIKGNITINGTKFNVTGVGYHEHMFADTHLFDSFFRFTSLKELSRVCHLYLSIPKWWLSEIINNGIKRTPSLHMSTDDLFGYDWIWVAFDNGWSMILYRIVALGVVDGLSTGVLILTDGKEYWEFGDFYTKIKRNVYLEERDIYIPLDFEITGFKNGKQFHVVFNSTTDVTKWYISNRRFEVGTFLVAGEANGFFKDGEKTVSLHGQGTNTPLRLIHKIKHRSLEIGLLLPPHGFGISIKRVSHRLGIERFFKLQLRPTFEFIRYILPSSIKDNTSLP